MKYQPTELISAEPIEVGFSVIRDLGRLRTEASVMMAAIPTGALTTRIAAEFAARCDQVARAVLRLERSREEPVDEALRDAARAHMKA